MDIFISYSSLDSQLAYRLYGDIVKFGGIAYIYEKQSDLVPYPKEIFQKISEAKAFCLIDSEAARKSDWVKKEVRFALKDNQRYANELVFVILAQPLWKGREKDILFKKINNIRAFNFSHSDYGSEMHKRFDVREYYYRSVEKICKKLIIPFTPPYPGNHDFQNELHINNWKGGEIEMLQKDLESILLKKKNAYPKIELRLQLLIEDCKRLGIKAITPSLVLGSFYFESQLNEKAKKLFDKLIIEFPQDPRSWILLSQATFRLGAYQQALEATLKSEQLLLKHQENPHLAKYRQEVIHNKVKLYIVLNRNTEANLALEQINPKLMILPEFKILRLLLKVKLGEFGYTENHQAYFDIRQFYEQNPVGTNEQLLMAELEHEIGKYFFNKESYLKAITHYRSAIGYADHNIQYQAELVLIYKIIGHSNTGEITTIYKKYGRYIPKDQHEHYYLGLLIYLQGKRRKAKRLFNSCRSLGYPYYKSLFDGNPTYPYF